jgi:hypothetical protein
MILAGVSVDSMGALISGLLSAENLPHLGAILFGAVAGVIG